MPVRGIVRGSTFKGTVTPANAPIYIDSDDNLLKYIPAGTGSTEVTLPANAVNGIASGYKLARGTGTLASGVVTVDTGLATIVAFTANITGTGAKTTGAAEVSTLQIVPSATGTAVVQGFFNSFVTGTPTISVSGTAPFTYIAIGT